MFSIPWLIVTIILAVITVITMFIPRLPSCVFGYATMWAFQMCCGIEFKMITLIFWGVAVVFVVANTMLLPDMVRFSRRGLGYIAGGALVGMALGLTMYRAATVIGGSILGALMGAIAYSRTSNGKVLEFPTVKFFNYLGAKGIPAVMSASMVGSVIAAFIKYYLIMNNIN